MGEYQEEKMKFGKMLSHKIENNVINIRFQEKAVFIKVLDSYIINFLCLYIGRKEILKQLKI